MAWDARWGKRLSDEPFWVETVFRVDAERSRVEAAITEQMPQPGEPTTWEQVREQILRLAPAQPQDVAPVKLTREQFAAIRAANPVYPEYARPSTFWGVPVQLVDTPEESTLAQGAAKQQVASEEPQVAAERGWLSRVLGRMFGREEQT